MVHRGRCKRWALRGSDFCQFHGGRRALQVLNRTGKRKLPSFYGKVLGPKLRDRVEELLSKPHNEQVQLYEELAISRATAAEALLLSSPLWDEEQAGRLTSETKALMIQTLGQAMDNVKNLVIAASRLEKEAEDKVSTKVLNLIVMQICVAVNEVCGTEHMSIAQAINDAIDEKVRLPLNNKIASTIQVRIGDGSCQ